MTKNLWPDSLKWQIEEALDGITEVSLKVRADDKAFYRHSVQRAVEVDRSYNLYKKKFKRLHSGNKMKLQTELVTKRLTNPGGDK